MNSILQRQLIQLLHHGDTDIDIAIMGKPPSSLNVRTELFAIHPHVFVASIHYPLDFQKKLSTRCAQST